MMKHVGIHVRLIVAAVILMGASTGAFFVGTNLLSTFVQARFEERIGFLASYLALNVELGILIEDHVMLVSLAENLLTQQDVVKVVISDNHGEPLADVALNTVSEKNNSPEMFRVAAPVISKKASEEDQALYWQMSPASVGDTIGQVQVFYTVDGINTMLGEIRNTFYILAAWLVTVLLIMFVLLSRFLVKPVMQLAAAARQVAQGNLGLRATPGNLPETRELAEAFNAMLDSLEQSNKALEKASQEMVRQKTLAEMGKFSLMIAHEVKNPLGIIKSSLDILKQDHNLSSDDTMVYYIEDEIQRMNRLIEEFLEFARPALPACRQTDMNALLKECVTRFELQSQEFPAAFRLDLPAQPYFLHVDPDLLTRVLSNIVKNGIEISNGKGKIDIFVFLENNSWVCRIKDRGPGIPPKNINKIFNPFYTTRAKGTGLGLAFASQVINAHNGTISAENRKEGGACFTITLPVFAEGN